MMIRSEYSRRVEYERENRGELDTENGHGNHVASKLGYIAYAKAV
jgi:hypothetical protein